MQVNKMNQEFVLIKETKENIGLDGILEDAKGLFYSYTIIYFNE